MTTKKLKDLMVVPKIITIERYSCMCPFCKKNVKSEYYTVFSLKRLEHYVFDDSIFKLDYWIGEK
ncbi:MAG: hypothetical protein ABSD42_03955 [Candidatus Bathyarchaeia archaeon]|jgi:hypothetical protein